MKFNLKINRPRSTAKLNLFVVYVTRINGGVQILASYSLHIGEKQ